jgi:hypothetical protein
MSAVVAMAPITTGAQTLENQSNKPRFNYKKEVVRLYDMFHFRLFRTKVG